MRNAPRFVGGFMGGFVGGFVGGLMGRFFKTADSFAKRFSKIATKFATKIIARITAQVAAKFAAQTAESTFNFITKTTPRFHAVAIKCATIIAAIISTEHLHARTDPFTPLLTPSTSLSQQKDGSRRYFTEINATLPSTARLLKEITITYQNIDGSTSRQSIKIDESIDWHFPLTISQAGAANAPYEAAKTITLGEFEITLKGEDIFIKTKLAHVRNFILPEPFRIAIDLESPSAGLSKEVIDTMREGIEPATRYVKKIHAERHAGLWRIVLQLDGRYAHALSKNSEGYLISLR